MNQDEPQSTPPEFLETIQDFSSVVTPPQRIGHYRILQKLGEGGMGVVYEAEQVEPVRRKVALKVIKMGMDTEQVVVRFESERQALALMNHPNIAGVYDAGATAQGRPYFVMEYVKGVPITEYCDQNRLNTRERLELFIQVCEGVQHAHQKGIIHRDIKPSNVLVRDQDGRHVPKIIDFGVAKATAQRLTEKTFYTELGQLIGTPEYMSPEQAEMSGMDIDTRTDVYLLGVMLYEMLAGELPFGSHELRKVGFNEFRRRVLEDEPPKPSTRVTHLGGESGERAKQRKTDSQGLARALRGDLDWITMKALEKDRTRRYASASELASDVQRFLNHEPVLASPPSNVYRLKKFVRRHQAGVGFAAVLLILLTGFAVAMTLQNRRITKERDKANAAASFSDRISSFMLDLFKESDPRETPGEDITVRSILDSGVRKIDELRGEPEVQARLKHTMADAYYGLGLVKDARPLADDALRLRRALAPDSLDVADTLALLGDIEAGSKDSERVQEMYEENLRIRREQFGDDSVEVAKALIKLVSLHGWIGDDAKAEEYSDEALRIMEKQLDPDDPQLTKVINNAAALLSKKGEYAEAQPLYERVLDTRRRQFGQNHQDVARALNNLADLHELRGDYAAARPLHEQALQIRENVFGQDHMQVASSLTSLAIVNLRLGDRSKAEELHARALSIYDKHKGLDNPFARYREAQYAALRGDRQAALGHLREAVLGRGYSDAVALRKDPNLVSLHGDSEFEAIILAVGRR